MSSNPFDQACRYLAKLDPVSFLAWLLGLPPGAFVFRRWLDTRLIRFPGEPERTCDTVAHLEHVAAGQTPWAVVVEFQIEPDALMPGRLLGYFGPLWLELKPAEGRGDRYHVGAVVVNLTGRGNTSRTMSWSEVGLDTQLHVREVNLTALDAAAILAEIVAGRVPPVVLPWVPLMHGGGESAIIQQWKDLAGAEADVRRRGDYGGLAKVFAEAAGCLPAWEEALKEWNMVQSKVVLEWQAEARRRGQEEGQTAQGVQMLLQALEARFTAVPTEVVSNIQAIKEPNLLSQLHLRALKAASLDEFLTALPNGTHG